MVDLVILTFPRKALWYMTLALANVPLSREKSPPSLLYSTTKTCSTSTKASSTKSLRRMKHAVTRTGQTPTSPSLLQVINLLSTPRISPMNAICLTSSTIPLSLYVFSAHLTHSQSLTFHFLSLLIPCLHNH